MYGNSAASSIDWRKRYRTVWHVDFEYREDANHLPIPVCLHAYEEHSGQSLSLWRDQLLSLKRAPFDAGPDSLMVAYAANAELSCFASLGWPFPANVLDIYVEVCAAINGSPLWPPSVPEGKKKKKGRPGLLAALSLFGLPAGMATAEKDEMRDLIIHNTEYTEEQRRAIQIYNQHDTDGTVALLAGMWPSIDLPRALLRGRFMATVARMERIGLPIDQLYFTRLLTAWQDIRMHYIRRDDVFHLYDEEGSFHERRLWDLVEARGWDWPRTPTGRYELKMQTLGKQARRYPELKSLVRLRDQIAELRINKLANTIGADGHSRCPLLPFWTVTSRCQPSAKDKMFLPALPAWLQGLIKPPPGMALVELDYAAEEVGIMAALSGDPAMIEDYHSGDPYIRFATKSQLVPADASKRSHPAERDLCKPIVLGQNYGMTPYGIAAKTGKSLEWSREIHARHRQIYSVFHRWLDDTVAQARFDEMIETPFGWPQTVTADTSTRSLKNYLAQGGGADLMRLVSIAAHESGLTIAAPVHDAFWLLAPISELDDTVERMKTIMTMASTVLTGGLPIGIEVEAVVRWPNCLGDVRDDKKKGQAMWKEIRGLIDTGLKEKSHG